MDINSLSESTREMILGGLIGGLIATAIIAFVIMCVVVYIYHALAWQAIAKKRKYKHPWLAWIPFANISQILELGKFHWAWVFLILIPILGWTALIVLMTIAMWRTFESLKQPGWYALLFPLAMIIKLIYIAYLVAIGVAAWKKK
jgi:hypothetical protein